MAWTQDNRQARIRLDLGADSVLLSRFVAHERLGEPFRIAAEVISLAKQIDFLPHMGASAGIDVRNEDGSIARSFHGHLTEAEFLRMSDEGFHYSLTLRPWLWLLSHRVDYRIFQEMTALEVIGRVFDDAGFSDYVSSLAGALTKREYCVQARESDLDFVSRLLEEEGVYYFFRHEAAKHTLVLCNSLGAHAKINGGDLTFRESDPAGRAPGEVHSWAERIATGPRIVKLRDFDFTKPKTRLEAEAEADPAHPSDAGAVYDYPGRFSQNAAGTKLADKRKDALLARRRLFSGASHQETMACGGLFTLKLHPEGRFNTSHLVVEHTYSIVHQQYMGGVGGAGDLQTAVESVFVAAPTDLPWAPERRTPKPVARGPETAMVTGPPGETIHVDSYGRVKVKFAWDRSTQTNDLTSCWVRVSQGWAGHNFGAVMLPRVGQEVIVDFLDGDPDRPLITGRVYNGDNPVPYDLPANKTQSGWRSQSVDGSATGFNEIRFEDKGGKEQVFIHAERDLDMEVEHDRTTVVKTGDETRTIQQGKRTTTIQKDETLTVTQGNFKTTMNAGDYDVKVDSGAVTIEAMRSITLKVGSSSIVLDQMGVTIKGGNVVSEAQMQWSAKGLFLQANGSSMTIIKGVLVTIN